MNMRAILRGVAKLYAPRPCVEGFIADKGIEYDGARLPKGIKPMREKFCFMNAAHLADRKRDLRYVEGYGFKGWLGEVPFHHAWCIDENDKVVDPTWRDAVDCKYIGVVVPHDTIWREQLKSGVYGVLWTPHQPNTALNEELSKEEATQ